MSLNQSYRLLGATGRSFSRFAGRVALMLALMGCLSLQSCKTPSKMVYMEDLEEEQVLTLNQPTELKIQPSDKLTIIVSSDDPELTAPFNMPLITTVAGQDKLAGYNMQVATYTVDAQGNIQFPFLGTIHAEGLTRRQLAQEIQTDLVNRKLLADPIVNVDFMNLYYSIAGEVQEPGRFSLDREGMTLLDAIARAGDLQLTGLRTNVKVIRRENNQQKIYVVDLTKGSDLASSPAFYLQQNDMIYVSPSDKKLREATVNGNNTLSINFWVSMASVLASIAVLIFK